MNLLANLDHLYDECKRNQWLRYFAVFCRVGLALGFIPSGIVKVMGVNGHHKVKKNDRLG